MEGEDRGTLSPARILWTGVAFGLLTGLLELVVVAVHRELLGRITRVSRDVAWMAPAADAVIFAAVALLLAAAGLVWPRLRSFRAVVSVFCGLSGLALALLIPGLHPLVLPLLAAGIGARGGALLARREARVRRWVPPATVAMVAVVGLLTVAGPVRARWQALDAGEEARAAPAGAPNVLLLILDTVRAGSLGLYGYGRATTPRLEAWAERGTVFDRAYAPAPWTLPSHGSFFTGRLPHELGTGFYRPLDDTYPTLAEVLTARGYETAGFTANLVYTTYVQGLDRGFQRYEDYPVSPGQALLSTALGRALAGSDPLRDALGHQLLNRKPARDVSRDFLRWLDGRGAEGPWFAFLNYFDAHEPYLPPPPFDRRFGPDRERDPLKHWASLRAGNEARRPDEFRWSPEDVRVDLEAYEESVAYVDHEVGRLLEALEGRGLLESTLVLIASDHGEQLGEHGLFYHWNSVYSTLLHVPLLAMGPGVPAGRRVGLPVSLRDLPATVMDLAGLAASPFPGRSLARTWSGGGAGEGGDPADRPAAAGAEVFSELELGPMFSLVRGPWHYILDLSSGRPREELYHVLRDPGETRDLTAEPDHGERVTPLRRRMIRFLEGAGAALGEGVLDGR